MHSTLVNRRPGRRLIFLGPLLAAVMAAMLALAAGAAAAPVYTIDLLPVRSSIYAMSNLGDVAGTIQLAPGIESRNFVLTKAGGFQYLPDVPGLPQPLVRAMNNDGVVVGYAGYEGIGQRAVVWTPGDSGYTAQSLGTLPGHDGSWAGGVDDHGRVVGFSYDASFLGPRAPFIWTQEDGMVDLTGLGAPNSPPTDLSPGGMLLHLGGWYSLDSPADAKTWKPAPPQFRPPNGYGAINDAGVQATWLRLIAGQEHDYAQLSRYDDGWSILSPPVSLQSGQNSVGGINNRGDIAAQIGGQGMVYFGDGTSRSLTSMIAPSYAGVSVYRGGDIDDAQEVVARAVIGNGTYAVKLVPAAACTGPSCIRSTSITLTAKLITPDPGRCVPGAYVRASAKVRIGDRRGRAIRGAVVAARFFNTAFDDLSLTGTTNSKGLARFEFTGYCGGGSVSLLVTGATMPGKQFDPTAGILVKSVIPR
jgi:hypothetical protein